MDKILEELMNGLLERNTEERDKDVEQMKANFKEVINTNCKCGIIITDTGIAMGGTKAEQLALISMLMHELVKNGKFDREILKTAVEEGLKDEEELDGEVKEKVEQIKNKLEKLKDMLEKM